MFVSVLSALLLAGALFYGALLAAFSWGFRRVFSGAAAPGPALGSDNAEGSSAGAGGSAQRGGSHHAEAPFVSVVIAARNEAGHIERCLRAVTRSRYPTGRFEVIVVDDFSSDDTAARVRQFITERKKAAAPQHARVAPGGDLPEEEKPAEAAPPAPRIRLLEMHRVASESTGHKREALNHGISAARGPLILTTDADCTPAPDWIGAMTGPLRAEERTAFVAGPVRYQLATCAEGGGNARRKSWATRLFEKAQALEFLALQAVGVGTIGLGRPTICNSANVAYRQSVYEALYRPETLGSADDELLIQHIVRETDRRVAFCPAPEARVETPPAAGLGAFLRQRQRWASMTPRYPDTGFTLALGGLYGFYVLLVAATVLAAWWPALLLPLGGAFALKLAAEAALLVPACRRFEQPGLLQALLPFQLPHALYLVAVVAAGTLGTTQWKGRTVE